MLIDLTEKVAVVTGAARGIGRTIAEQFAREGATVVALEIDAGGLRDFEQAFEAEGWAGGGIACDVRDTTSVQQAIDLTVQRYGRIDILVNNAGINATGLVEELDGDLWDRCFDVNVRGTFNTCQAVIPVMKRQKVGRIINAASFAAIMPSVGGAAYAASKSAVVQFTRTLAGELGPWNITANSYAPGMIPTAINGFAQLPEDEQSRRLDMLSIRRWGETGDVANLLCFLASDLSGYITGTMIDISGGKFATQIPSQAYSG